MAITSRITPTGTFYTTGQIDEATFNPNSGYLKNQAANTAGNPWSLWGSTSNIIISTNEPAPDGTFTAVRFRPTGQYQGGRTLNASWLPNVIQTRSVWCKVDSGTQLMVIGLNGGGIGTYFTANSTWQRFVSDPYVKYVSYLDYFVIGTFNTSGFQDFILWGPQVELGNVATAYEATDSTGKPALKTANKIDSNGNYYITGTFDETSYNSNSGVIKNLVINSQNFIGSDWSKVNASISSNTEIAPDGTNTASFYKEKNSNTFDPHQFYKGINPLANNTVYVLSCYYKPTANRYLISPGLGNAAFGGADIAAMFNLKTLTVSNINPLITNYGITNVGNGWYRCFVTMKAIATGFGTIAPFTMLGKNDVLDGYSGDGASGIYVWGCQLEIGDAGPNSTPSIYVPTTSSTIPNVPYKQRVSINGNNYVTSNYDEVTYNPNSGVITNLLGYSSQLNTAPWFVGSIANPSQTTLTSDPNKSLTAWKLIETSVSSGHSLQQSGISKPPGSTLTLTVYAKAAQRTGLGLVINDGVNGFSNRYGAEFDLLAGTAYNHDGAQGTFTNGSFSISSVGEGWYRCLVTVTTSTEILGQIRIMVFPNPYVNWTSNAGYVGDGTSGIYVWGPQLQIGSTSTEYVVTGANGIPIPQ